MSKKFFVTTAIPHARKDIDCSTLKTLYLKRKLSLFKIGKILHFSSRTINIRAKECKINLRSPGLPGPKISNKELESLYLKRGLSSRKIAKKYNCTHSCIDSKIKGLGLPTRTRASAHITTKRKDFTDNIYEKAYLIGFRIGDLRTRRMYQNSETILVDCGSTQKQQIELIKRLFEKYGRVWTSKPKSNGKIQIECGLNKSFSFLLRKYQKFPAWVSKNKEVVLPAIAGFSDAEGSFYIEKNGRSSGFAIGNYNSLILKQMRDWLIGCGYKPRLFLGVKKGYTGKDGYSHKENYWILSIYRKKDILLFAKKIFPYLKHEGKIKAANKVIKNINYRNLKYGFIGM